MQSNNKITPSVATKDHILESYNMPPPPPYSPTSTPSAPPVSPPSCSTHSYPSTSYPPAPMRSDADINMIKPPIQAKPVLYPSLALPPNDSTVYISSTSLHNGGSNSSNGPYTIPTGANQFGGAAVIGSQHPQAMIPAASLTYAGELQMSTYRQQIVCPYCMREVTTNTTHRIGMLNHLSAVAACWLALCCCACVPYFIKGLKDVEHYCPICGRMLGVHRKLNF